MKQRIFEKKDLLLAETKERKFKAFIRVAQRTMIERRASPFLIRSKALFIS